MGDCTHTRSEPRRRTIAGGALVVALQCLECGTQIRCLPKRELRQEEVDALRLFDEDIRVYWQDAQREKLREDREQRRAASQIAWEDDYHSWWRWYQDYLQSADWQERRHLVLQRCKGACEGCGGARATQVHHLTYAHVGSEFLWELVGICTDCHERVTPRDAKDRWDRLLRENAAIRSRVEGRT